MADQREIWNRDEGSHADIGHVTKTAIFANSRWQMPAILKIALSPYLSRELSDFDQIWYTDTNFHSEHENLTKNSKFFKFKMVDGRHIENHFLAIYRRHIGRFTQISRKNWRHTCSLNTHFNYISVFFFLLCCILTPFYCAYLHNCTQLVILHVSWICMFS